MSAIAWTGSYVVIVNVDDEGKLVYWQLRLDRVGLELGWLNETVATGQASAAIAWTGSAVVIAAADAAGNLAYWSKPVGASAWSPAQPLGSSCSSPDIVGSGDSAVVTATDAAGNVLYWWHAPGATWNLETLPSGGGMPYSSASIAWTGYSAVITANSEDLLMHYWWQPNELVLTPTGKKVWNPTSFIPFLHGSLPGAYYANPSIAWTGTGVVIAVANGDGFIQYFWHVFESQLNTVTWTTQTLPQQASLDIYSYTSIAWTGSSVVIAASDVAGVIRYWWLAAGSTEWNGPQTLPGSGRYRSTSIVGAGNAVFISAVDANTGNLYCWSQPTDANAPWELPVLVG